MRKGKTHIQILESSRDNLLYIKKNLAETTGETMLQIIARLVLAEKEKFETKTSK